jgi:hypothetical protein
MREEGGVGTQVFSLPQADDDDDIDELEGYPVLFGRVKKQQMNG